MWRLVDRVLTRIAGKATADAGCSRYYYCKNHTRMLRVCCKDEGCQYIVVGQC